MRTTHAVRAVRLAVGVAAAVALLAGCTTSSGADGAGGAAGRTDVNYALPANATPNWIVPLGIAGKLATHNSAIMRTLWEPLVAYDGSEGEVGRVAKADLASDITFSDDGRTATITLDDRTWSDGEPVTSADVKFWFELVKANTDVWASYSEGRMPDNVTEVATPDDKTVELTFDKVYNPEWLQASQLTLIVPLPAHAWAKTADDEEPDPALAETDEGAKEIFDYLVTQSEDLSTYESNPLWQTINGPYSLTGFTDAGQVELTKNDKYDGDDAASIDTVNLLPYTSTDAEVNAVRSGAVDYGYIPTTGLDAPEQYEQLDYTIEPWAGWSITYLPYNFNHPELGPVYRQLYVRQALQHLVDQEQISDVIWKGAALPGYGPVPQNPESDFLSDEQKANPYPFDPEAAAALLADHGWTAGSDGVLECTAPGDGDDECGEGVKDGQKLAITILTQSGSAETDNMFAEIKSTFDKAGVAVTIESAPLNTVLSSIAPCTADQPDCDWQLPFFGTAGSWYFGGYPSGERVFGTGAASNFGSYSDEELDTLMHDSTESTDPSVMQEYSKYGAENLPVMWLPNPVYQVSVIKNGLEGTTQDPLASFHPQRWSWAD
jgi:peptide/nickel transport system substrate-binding protein